MTNDPFAAPAGPSPFDAEALSFLGGSSLTAAKWPAIGFNVTGDIVNWDMRDQTDMDTGELVYWVGKKPTKESEIKGDASRLKVVRQLVINLQCVPTFKTWETIHYNEVALPDDDGMRAVYVKGALQVAVSKAMTEAQATLEKGARISITRTQNRKATSGFTAYTYTAVWTPASRNAGPGNSFLTTPAPDQAPFSPQPFVPPQSTGTPPFDPSRPFG